MEEIDKIENKSNEDSILINELRAKIKLLENENEELYTLNSELIVKYTKSQSCFENAPDAVFIIDAIGKFIEVNPVATLLSGFSKDELLNMSFKDIILEDDIENALIAFNELKNIGKVSLNLRYKHKTKDEKWCSVNAVKISENRILGFVRDITEKKTNELILVQKNKELIESNTSKDKFFSIIAHDLKSPFSGFLGLTKIMSEDLNSLSLNEIYEISKTLQDSAKNLYQLLENLLEWSRMQRGNIQYNPDSIDLKYLIDQNINILLDFSNQKQIKVICKITENSKVFADVPMLNTIFRNLLSNAIKFTTKNGTIVIGIDEGYESNVNICLFVKDSGIGMDSELLNDLFKLDVNVSRPGTEGESSTGLGLLLCKEFVNKNNGKIWVESEVNVGSTFYFTLPKSE